MKNKEEITGLSSEDLCFTPAVKLRDMIRNKLISPVELISAFLKRIEKINPKINAYCTVAAESALQSAKEAEIAIMRGDAMGQLHGIPVSIKDCTLTAGIRTTFGSKLYKDFIPDSDALVVERLKKAGAIIVGKTNLPEFAAGGSTFNQVFGATCNPWNTDFNSGGSSGGAAAAVAAGLGPLAEGNDLGGSLRIPASFCGIVGLRPSPGRVPWHPSELYWDTLAVEGPMARTVPDVALMLDVISGPDDRSPVSISSDGVSFLDAVGNSDLSGAKIAWSDNLNLTPVDHEVLDIARSATKVFSELGCDVTEGSPDFSNAGEIALVLRGLRYAALYQDQLDDPEFKKAVNPLIIGNIEQGLRLSVRDIARAERQRSEMWGRVGAFFEYHDFLLTPTVPLPPFPVDTIYPKEINGKPMQNYVDWVMLTYAISMTGLPAITVPCGWTQNGLPVGLQIVGRRHSEAALLQAAAAYELEAPWTGNRPSL